MKSNSMEMIFILDKSGSMYSLTEDTIGGFNSMIEQQKNESDEAFVTTVLFDSRYKTIHDHVNIKEISPMTTKDYMPSGSTALLDAVGNTINSVGIRLNNTPEEERPEKVAVVIVTDGYENSSVEFSKSQIKEMIEHQTTKYSWAFTFLGANIDAVSVGESYGIKSAFCKTYTASKAGTANLYNSVASAMCCMMDSDFDINDENSAAYKSVTTALDQIN